LLVLFTSPRDHGIVRMQVNETNVSFLRGSGAKGWYIDDRWSPLHADIAAAIVQPVKRYRVKSDIDKNSTGNHWLLLLFVNWQSIKFTGKCPRSARAGAAKVLRFDSLVDATADDDILLMQQAFQEFLSQAAARQHTLDIGIAREVVASVPWEQVGFTSPLCHISLSRSSCVLLICLH